MNSGKLNRRITYYETGLSEPDGVGGVIVTEGDPITVWAGVKQLSMSETLRYGLEIGEIRYTIALRYDVGKNITQGSKLLYDSKILRVTSVLGVDEAKKVIVLLATERNA